jgi:hypothetical protein
MNPFSDLYKAMKLSIGNPSINNVDDAYKATGIIQKSDYEDLAKSIFSGLFQTDVYVRKAIVQEEKQLVYGIVYEPDVLDSQGDYMTAESIQKAAHAYMTSLKVDTQHNFVEGAGTVVESYIAQSTFEIGEHVIKEGSWVLVTEATNEIWEGIKEGKYTGYSMAGTADTKLDPSRQSYKTD